MQRNETYFFCEEQTLYGSARLGTEQVEHSMRGLVTKDGLTDAITRAREQHGDDWQSHLQQQYDGRFYERLQDAWGNEWSTRLDLLLQGNNDGWLIEQIKNESYTLQAGTKRFELSNHLGNVQAVVSDKKVQLDGVVWQAEVVSAQDYFPFGMAMPSRSTTSTYKYGFNGQEKDTEMGKASRISYIQQHLNEALSSKVPLEEVEKRIKEATDNCGEVTKVDVSPPKSSLSKGFFESLQSEMSLFFLIFCKKIKKNKLISLRPLFFRRKKRFPKFPVN